MDTRTFEVRRSSRARRVRVTVHPDRRVEVVLPQRAPQKAAAAAVAELEPWIEKRLRSLDRAHDELARPANTLPFLGADLELVASPAVRACTAAVTRSWSVRVIRRPRSSAGTGRRRAR